MLDIWFHPPQQQNHSADKPASTGRLRGWQGCLWGPGSLSLTGCHQEPLAAHSSCTCCPKPQARWLSGACSLS